MHPRYLPLDDYKKEFYHHKNLNDPFRKYGLWNWPMLAPLLTRHFTNTSPLPSRGYPATYQVQLLSHLNARWMGSPTYSITNCLNDSFTDLPCLTFHKSISTGVILDRNPSTRIAFMYEASRIPSNPNTSHVSLNRHAKNNVHENIATNQTNIMRILRNKGLIMIRYGSNKAGLCQPLWKLIQIIFSCLTKLKQSNVNFTAKKQLNVIFFSRKTNQIRNLFLPIPVYCKSLLGSFSELKEKKGKK